MMEELRVIRLSDFKGELAVGLSGAPEVREGLSVIAADAERQFYGRLLGVTEARRFFEDLAAEDASAAAFADATRYAVTRYAYCMIAQDSQDSLHALNGVFRTDSATGEPVAVNRRLTDTWNTMCRYLHLQHAAVESYRSRVRQELGLSPSYRFRIPFAINNTLML